MGLGKGDLFNGSMLRVQACGVQCFAFKGSMPAAFNADN